MNKRFVFFTPLLMAVGLGVILYTAIGKDPTKLETARLDDPVPEFNLPALADRQKTYTAADLKGKVRLLNVWATWCPSCKAEHGFLVKLSEMGVPIVGLNYKDDRPGALTWLQNLGDPYEFNIFDVEGRLGFDLGVYGAPETYVIDANGIVRHRHVGELNDRVWTSTIEPLIKSLENPLLSQATP